MTGLIKRMRGGVSCLCLKRHQIDVLAWIPEGYFSEKAVGEIAKAKPNSIVISGSLIHGKYVYAHLPPGRRFRREPFLNALLWLQPCLGYVFYPIFLMLDTTVIFLFYLWMGLRFRVNTVYVSDARFAVAVGLLRKLGLFRRLVYWAGDWFQGNSLRTGIWSRLGNDVYFPIVDWLSCKLSDLTVNHTDLMGKTRTQYWGRQIPRNETVFVPPPLTVECRDASVKARAHNILFMGTTRPDSGLDIVLKALQIIRERQGDMPREMTVKVVGPDSPALRKLTKFADECGLGAFLEYAGFTDRAAFEAVFADCYCGVNLITDPNSYTSKTVPVKLLDYFQYLLPALVTPYVGPKADTIRELKLGLVVSPEVEAVASALIELYEHRSEYVQNIQTFLTTQSPGNIVQILCPADSVN